MLRSYALEVGYRRQAVLGPLDLHLPKGRLVCLLGANGAGKSTLIRTLSAMQRAVSGRIELDGQPLDSLAPAERAKRMAVVLTDRVDPGALSGFELAALGRYPHVGWAGRLNEHDRHIVTQALEHAGAGGLAAKAVANMSDGERQKVLLARALAQQPKVLILDEITAFLDLPRRIETLRLLQQLARERDLAILLSCHDLELALRCADLLWLIDQSRQLQCGAPEDLVLDGRLGQTFSSSGLHFDLERGEWGLAARPGRPVRLQASGITRVWTQRALHRIGYQEAGHAALHISAEPMDFRLRDGERTQRFSSLGQLVVALEALP
ncbi:ABC transporter ATP-binding protein [Pseudomonas sp. IT-P176]|uniref:ABC transporter ATP-binding protein n=1 Tax=Pseudomonas sp. IT-P176 TaxID=3026444 RepID=UPI0039DF3E03